MASCWRIAVIAGLAGLVCTGHSAAQTLSCEGRPALHAVPITGEAYGGHNFVEPVADGLRLGLSRARWGWRILVLDDADNDLLPVSPMRGGLPEPRELYGWHFRNTDNTGANAGEVNAPQHERVFTFNPPGDGEPATGMGWLRIEEMALSDLGAGEQASIGYLQYSACLMWPKTDEDMAAEADAGGLEFLPEEVEIIRGCGLDAQYALDARIAPRMVGGDFDGDDAHDQAVFVRRISDGARGVAICRAGAWLDVLGVDGPVPGSPMDDGLFGSVEAWRVAPIDAVMTGWDGEAPRPETVGDVLVLERFEKELYSIYWNGSAYRSHQHYRFVEP